MSGVRFVVRVTPATAKSGDVMETLKSSRDLVEAAIRLMYQGERGIRIDIIPQT